MATNYGLFAANQAATLYNQTSVLSAISNGIGVITSVRVKSIILNESHPRFQELGEWNSLGVIEYQSIDNPHETTFYPLAYPVYANNKNLPLINEIVYLITLPDTGIGELPSPTRSYYFNSVSIWNHPHHNAYPLNSNTPPESQQKDYQQTQAGSVRRVTDQSTEIYLGNTFKERSNIHPLLPFEGDVIQEGRWGNSIRFGSTVKKRPNNWSEGNSTNGDPITIIRNGQSPKASKEGWIPITEDINNDLASIYATSTQQIPLNTSSTSYYSYKSDKPVTPNKYQDNQLILSSGRLVFNSSADHILLSAKKTVNLNAVTSVNIDAPDTIIQSNNVYLGSKDATQPVLLGNTTVQLLDQLITNLNAFMTVCSTVVGTAPGVSIAPLNMAASQMVTTLNQLQANLEGTKSKSVKTA